MKLITNNIDFKKEIKNVCKKNSQYIYISSYGLQINIFLENIIKNSKEVKIIIGMYKPSARQLSFLNIIFQNFLM